MRLVVATHNPKKAGEMLAILGRRFPAWELRCLADCPGAPEPAEEGATYAENALIKARSAAAFTGEWSLADDAGLEIDALGGAPGLLSRRFAGEETPFPEKMRAILEMLRAVPGDRRGARFRCCVAVCAPQGAGEWVFEATCEGSIAEAPRGSGGFGYDPIFWLPERECTMAELTPWEKHEISHRGKALREVGDWLAARFAA
jgi:XTP/dITP diphosphohydrolase